MFVLFINSFCFWVVVEKEGNFIEPDDGLDGFKRLLVPRDYYCCCYYWYCYYSLECKPTEDTGVLGCYCPWDEIS